MTKKIQVIVSPQGATTIRTTGFQGTECRAATKAIEAALGISASEQLAAEYYQPAAANERQHENQ